VKQTKDIRAQEKASDFDVLTAQVRYENEKPQLIRAKNSLAVLRENMKNLTAIDGELVLKGALMLTVWEAPLSRPTMDIDFLGQIDNSIEATVNVIKDICRQQVEPDGITFDLTQLRQLGGYFCSNSLKLHSPSEKVGTTNYVLKVSEEDSI